MRGFKGRVCHAEGSAYLMVPAAVFKSLGGVENTPLQVEIRPSPPKKLSAPERMARYREVLKLKGDGLGYQEIADELGVSYTFANNVCKEFGSADLMTTETRISRYANRAVEKAFGLKKPMIIDLQKAIEADPAWRLRLLRHCSRIRLREIEGLCEAEGIRIEPAVHGNNFEGLTVRSYEKLRGLTGKLHPRLKDIKTLMDKRPKRLAEAFAQDPGFKKEMDAFYEYKSEKHWMY
jgi:hypothetical protein